MPTPRRLVVTYLICPKHGGEAHPHWAGPGLHSHPCQTLYCSPAQHCVLHHCRLAVTCPHSWLHAEDMLPSMVHPAIIIMLA